jgi:hypothetical protein
MKTSLASINDIDGRLVCRSTTVTEPRSFAICSISSISSFLQEPPGIDFRPGGVEQITVRVSVTFAGKRMGQMRCGRVEQRNGMLTASAVRRR